MDFPTVGALIGVIVGVLIAVYRYRTRSRNNRDKDCHKKGRQAGFGNSPRRFTQGGRQVCRDGAREKRLLDLFTFRGQGNERGSGGPEAGNSGRERVFGNDAREKIRDSAEIRKLDDDR